MKRYIGKGQLSLSIAADNLATVRFVILTRKADYLCMHRQTLVIPVSIYTQLWTSQIQTS